jgi:SAM-dependent methyltransferase
MRTWSRYFVVEPSNPTPRDHFSKIGGYLVGDEYASKDQFFQKHIFGHERIAAYNDYLLPLAHDLGRTLSLAAGRCANELYLTEKFGVDVLCSDIEEPPCIPATRGLFPYLKFQNIDVLNDAPVGQFDSVLVLGLTYAFNDDELDKLISYCGASLRSGGLLVFDLSAASNSVVGRLFNDFYLQAEAKVMAPLLSVKHGKKFIAERDQHGYRRSLRDVQPRMPGFELLNYQERGMAADLSRSAVFSSLDARIGIAKNIGTVIASRMPFIRIGTFVRK